MKKITFFVIALLFVAFSSLSLSAKCYSFRDGDEYKVCVKGDSFSDREKAMAICKNAKGSDCGSVSSYSSSCHSNSGKCYNENGKASRSHSGY